MPEIELLYFDIKVRPSLLFLSFYPAYPDCTSPRLTPPAPPIHPDPFATQGRAEAPRLALTIGDIPFKDERFKFPEFGALKESGRLPFGQVPILTVDGVQTTQSAGILRYCGRVSGLYPRDDDLLALSIDEVLGVMEDAGTAIFKYRGKDQDQLKAAREEFTSTVMPKLLGGIEKIVKAKATSETWLCGDSISIADLQAYYMIGNIKHGFVDHVSPDSVDAYPRLMASYNAVMEHPKVKAWNEKYPWKRA